MKFISVFNDVLGPVMRGPSSSHTAGAYRIGRMVRDLLAEDPVAIRVSFDPGGSMAPTYRPLGVDLAFTAGVMGWSMLDGRYIEALDLAQKGGVAIDFQIAPLEHTDHPNGMLIEIESARGRQLRVVAEAVGGGDVRLVRLQDWKVDLDGRSHEVLVEIDAETGAGVVDLLSDPSRQVAGSSVLLSARSETSLSLESVTSLRKKPGVTNVWGVSPVFFVRKGETTFSSAAGMVAAAGEGGLSLGGLTRASEAELLGMSEDEVVNEMLRRYEIMERSIAAGLDDDLTDMLLLHPTASRVLEAERGGRVAIGGIHTRAAARALAVMHCCNSRGVICAAPTGGSAGTLPGVVVSLVEELDLSRERVALALFAASAVGLIVARRATFAAEIAGCQVEIGVSGAMAAAAVVEAVGGTALQAADAAAISLQNTMGSPCDPVAGACEVPCHTRNAVAASSAFTCADLILGGYANPIPLDETIDASYEVGKTLPSELRCTARGGCATAPSALGLPHLR